MKTTEKLGILSYVIGIGLGILILSLYVTGRELEGQELKKSATVLKKTPSLDSPAPAPPAPAPPKPDSPKSDSPTSTSSAPTSSTRSIIVDLSTQTLTRKNSENNKVYKISSGKPGTPTPVSPSGEPYKIIAKELNYTLKEPLAKGQTVKVKYWMELNVLDKSKSSRGIAIHASNIWGLYPGSGGCIRMNPTDARELFDLVKVGTHVTIVGSEKVYLEKNSVYPWQINGEKELIEKMSDGTNYKFKKEINDEMTKLYVNLIDKKRLGIYRPTPKQKRDDPRWKTTKFINFPNIDRLGNLATQSYTECEVRYLTLKELQKALKRNLQISPD